jgi:putative ABC transport system substrate-binding protein
VKKGGGQQSLIIKGGFCLAVAAMVSTLSASARAQPAKIGFLGGPLPSAVSARIEALRQRLRELGYIEGKNIIIEYRYAEDKLDRLPALAAELVRAKSDIIVTGGPASTRAAKKATATIPIVMAQDIDPVATGSVASLSRPGGNVTGLTTFAPEISGKQLEVLKQSVPTVSRVAAFGTSITSGSELMRKEVEVAAGALGVKLKYLNVLEAKDIEPAFRGAINAKADAAIVLFSFVLNSHRATVVKLATSNRLPVIYPFSEFVEAGGLMNYGVSYLDLYRRAATYVDKILKGAKPADLPVEQPTKFELVINLKTAKQIGLTIPPNVLARADRVIR